MGIDHSRSPDYTLLAAYRNEEVRSVVQTARYLLVLMANHESQGTTICYDTKGVVFT